MLGIDAKEFFQQLIYNVLIILFTIHLVSVTFSYIIKWIRPYLKRHTVISNKQESNSLSDKVTSVFENSLENMKQMSSSSLCCSCKGEIFGNECFYLIDNLKTLMNITDKSSKSFIDPLIKINMMTDSEFENALNFGHILRSKLKKNNNCSNEVQTIISIDPKTNMDYSSSELLLCDLFSHIKSCESSESFLSASSSKPGIENQVIDEEIEQIIKEIVLNQELINQNLSEQKIEINSGKSTSAKSNNISLIKTDRFSFLKQNQGKQSGQDNKLLEMAITEFEKELKPIKDQIKMLKECINGFDSHCKPFIRAPSDISSSLSGSIGFSECFSGTLSTTCSSDIQSFMSSSYHIISEKTFGQFKPDSRLKNIKILDEIVSADSDNNSHKRKNQSSSQPISSANVVARESGKPSDIKTLADISKIKKRSPLAEMYVKLSQCNSQSSCKNRKEKSTHRDNTVTYRIDLNVNLAGVSTVNCQKPNPLQDREMQPLMSQPEDIFNKVMNSSTALKSCS